MSHENMQEAIMAAIEAEADAMPAHPEVMEQFDQYWRPLVCDKQGNLDINKVADELFDYSFVLDQVPKVYMDITGGKLSKPHYLASVVIAEATDYTNKLWDEVLKDERQQWAEDLIERLPSGLLDDIGPGASQDLIEIIRNFTNKETE